LFNSGSRSLTALGSKGVLVDEYQDYDMVNSHPTLLLEYCLREMQLVPYYLKYVEERDSFLETKSQIDGSSIEEAKTSSKRLNTSESHARELLGFLLFIKLHFR
jgi:hypothetical protein